jgi:hypothetical protein
MCLTYHTCISDFMDRDDLQDVGDYFSGVNNIQQKYPDFTVRNINELLHHSKPMLHNVYEFIRGREIFDRVESFKAFLNDIRL